MVAHDAARLRDAAEFFSFATLRSSSASCSSDSFLRILCGKASSGSLLVMGDLAIPDLLGGPGGRSLCVPRGSERATVWETRDYLRRALSRVGPNGRRARARACLCPNRTVVAQAGTTVALYTCGHKHKYLCPTGGPLWGSAKRGRKRPRVHRIKRPSGTLESRPTNR